MSKKTITAAIIILTLLVSSVFSITAVYANFVSSYYFYPANPITDKPTISLISPALSPNGIVLPSNSLQIKFNVTSPETWNWLRDDGSYHFMGTITSVVCEVDQTELLHNDNVLGDTENYSTLSGIYQINYQYTGTAQNLSSGMHKVTISVNAHTLYALDGGRIGQYDVSVNDTYYFMLNTPPTVNLLSIQNRTYNRTEIPLIFQVDTSKTSNYGWLGFSLDNQANVTIYGNSTLTGLSEGNHSLIVYANDTFGNMGKSDMVFFNVSLPAPTPSPTATPNPNPSYPHVTAPLTAFPTPFTSPTAPEFPITALAITLLAITILVGANFGKRKRGYE